MHPEKSIREPTLVSLCFSADLITPSASFPGGNDPNQAATRAQNYAKGLEKAKEAVALAPEDPLNWETFGCPVGQTCEGLVM